MWWNNPEMPEMLRNTSQMSLQPDSRDDFVQMDPPREAQEVELLPVYTGEAFTKLVAYQIIVGMWKKKDSGRVKRAWLKTFTQAERKTISNYHGRFYQWLLTKGVPKHVSCRMHTLNLLIRAVDFFATI